MLGLAGWVHKEHDGRFQSLDLVQVHNADSRSLVGSRRHAVVLLFLFDDLPQVLCQVGGRPQSGLLCSQQLDALGQAARLDRSSRPPCRRAPSSPRSATIFSMAATGGILASHRAYFLSRSKASWNSFAADCFRSCGNRRMEGKPPTGPLEGVEIRIADSKQPTAKGSDQRHGVVRARDGVQERVEQAEFVNLVEGCAAGDLARDAQLLQLPGVDAESAPSSG